MEQWASMIEFLSIIVLCFAGPAVVQIYKLNPMLAYLVGFIFGGFITLHGLKYDANKKR